MINQYFTFCKRCGKQILITRCENTGRWVACDPEIHQYRRSGGPMTYVNEHGELCHGVREHGGEWGYRRHRNDCARSVAG